MSNKISSLYVGSIILNSTLEALRGCVENTHRSFLGLLIAGGMWYHTVMAKNCTTQRFQDRIEVTLPTGHVTVIDISDQWIMEIFPSWQYRKGYVGCERWVPTEFGNVLQRLYLHRLITGTANRWQVDHADRNKLNNRRSNLRMASAKQNSANSVRATRSKTGFRGVSEDKRPLKRKFIAHLAGTHLGRYETAEQAARAYDTEAKRVYGDFAVQNFTGGSDDAENLP